MGGQQYLSICTKGAFLNLIFEPYICTQYRNGDVVNSLVNSLFAACTKFRYSSKEREALNRVFLATSMCVKLYDF